MSHRVFLLATTLFLASFANSAAAAVVKTYDTAAPAAGSLRFRWIFGSVAAALNRDPRIQVQGYNEDTFILRENICINFEAPFMHLIMGNERALLIDTGATVNAKYFPLRATVDAVLKRWCAVRGLPDVPLTIVLTSPEDFVQNKGYEQFRDRPNTTLAPLSLTESKAFFGFATSWPNENGKIDLGGRVISVIPTPGTHQDGLSFYDPYTQFLYTGDFIFPGRVVIGNDDDYLATATKLKAFVGAHPVKWILGGHVEMADTPGVDFVRRKFYHPNEHVLQLAPAILNDVVDYAGKIQGRKDAIIRPEYILMNRVGPGNRTFSRPPDLPPAPPPANGGGLR